MTSLGGTHHSFLTVSDMDKNIMCTKKKENTTNIKRKAIEQMTHR